MKTIDDYLDKLGPALVEHAKKQYPPLQKLSDPFHPGIKDLARTLFDRQAHAVTAITKAFDADKRRLWLCGECGSGKTTMAASAVHLHGRGNYRAFVMAPGHLLEKWPSEIEAVVPDAKICVISDWREALHIPRVRQGGPEWFVIGKDRAKLQPYTAAAVWKRSHIGDMICPQCGAQPVNSKGTPLGIRDLGDHASCDQCQSPLWTFTLDVQRWSPARTIHKRLRGCVDYFLCDEGHQCKGEDTEISKAFHRLMLASKFSILLTGTATGGKAEDLRPLLHRMFPSLMQAEGWSWGNPKPFLERYGRVETTTKDKAGSIKKTARCVPGIMPDLFGRLLIDSAVFVSLEDVAEGLPDYHEELVSVPMDEAVREAYDDVEADLRSALAVMLKRNDKRLLGAMLATLLAYPDYPWDWRPVGYLEREMTLAGLKERFVQVAHPPSLTRDCVYNKERELVRICKEAKSRGEQVWVYVQFTGDHNVPERLQKILRDHEFSVTTLRQSVSPDKREKWIVAQGPKHDVIISHPALVETGVDLFCKQGRHNFNNLVFYQCGYSLYTLRQASRRAMRLSQKKTCRTYYLFHERSMSERAVSLMGTKLLFAAGLEGKFSTEGLTSLGADDSIILALAKSICDRMKPVVSLPGAKIAKAIAKKPEYRQESFL